MLLETCVMVKNNPKIYTWQTKQCIWPNLSVSQRISLNITAKPFATFHESKAWICLKMARRILVYWVQATGEFIGPFKPVKYNYIGFKPLVCTCNNYQKKIFMGKSELVILPFQPFNFPFLGCKHPPLWKQKILKQLFGGK